MKFVVRLLVVCLLAFTSFAFAADTRPDALVKSTVDDVLAVIKQTRDRQALRELAEVKVLPHFDFRRMTQLAVGPAWKQANPAQQQALENAFRTLLVNTYVSALTSRTVGTAAVEVQPLKSAAQDEATVRTVVRADGQQPVKVDYRLANGPDGWKVFDVIVEELSLVTNYRGSFATEINRHGIDGLISTLEEKNRSLAKS